MNKVLEFGYGYMNRMRINPKIYPHCGFSENVSSKERVKPWLKVFQEI